MASLRVCSLVLMCSCLMVVAGCKRDACPKGFCFYQDSCYWFSNIKEDFPSARAYCGFFNSRLAVITSEEENNFMKDMGRNNNGTYFWLGAADLASEGTWMWEGNRTMKYNDWAPNFPCNQTSFDCLVLHSGSSYSWRDGKCQEKGNFICEKCSS